MIIVHVIADLGRGGAEMMLKRLLEAHASRPGLKHHVISLDTLGAVGPEIQALGVPVEALGMSGAADIPRVIVRLVRRFRALRPDIVHAWMYRANLLAGLAARLARVPHVIWGIRVSELTTDMGVSRATIRLQALGARLSRSLPNRIVYVAQSARDRHERLGYSADRGVVIPNGYRVPAKLPRDRLRSELRLPADALIVGTAGRFQPQKGFQALVEVGSMLAARDSRLHFVLAGKGVSPDNQELLGWVRAGGMAGNFHLLGERTEMSALLAGMDVFCLNSIGEGFPNVVAEAMSVGVPCIVTDVGDSAYLVGDSGIVIPARDPQALARALTIMAGATPEVRRSYGDRGRERINACFAMESVATDYAELYRDLAGAERSH